MTLHEREIYIAQRLGAEIHNTEGQRPFEMWQVKKENCLYSILGNHVLLPNTMRFHKDWGWMMAAIEQLSQMENKSIMMMLLTIAGVRCNSLTQLFDNLYDYLNAKENETKNHKNYIL